MLRTTTCGALNLENLGENVTLCGWMQNSRDLGGMTFIDIRDRYGITQLVFNMNDNVELCEAARNLGREFVIKVSGTVVERSNKNKEIPTGDVEIKVSALEILNAAKLPPFLIEDKTDGGDDLRMKYRYLDLRRTPVRNNLLLRHKMAQAVRRYLDALDFIEVETPFLIKSTPEGARDFVVPSRMNTGEFYALPQSPQTFKQLLMVSGFDRYFQIVRCFRDEDLRADRQPEFTQIDMELSFVDIDDILDINERMMQKVFKDLLNVDIQLPLQRMPYKEAMERFGSDKPDIRFDMKFLEMKEMLGHTGFVVFDDAEYVGGICAEGCAGAFGTR